MVCLEQSAIITTTTTTTSLMISTKHSLFIAAQLSDEA